MMKAVRDYVIVDEVEDNEKQITKAGILIVNPNSQRKAYWGISGTIVSISDQCDPKILRGLKVGDRIMYNKYESIPFMYEGKFYQAIHDHWVMLKK